MGNLRITQRNYKKQTRRFFASRNPLIPSRDENGYRVFKKPVYTTKNSMRNQPCPCGSRKKYKKCCWSKVTY